MSQGFQYFNEKPHIIIVDDEDSIRDMLKRHFQFLGYEVEDCASAKQALELMEKKRFEVMISDISMPEMTGIELLERVSTEYPMMHCIMVTGYVTMGNILSCMRFGADTCIFKPIEDMGELERAVKQAVDQLHNWQSKLKEIVQMKPGDA